MGWSLCIYLHITRLGCFIEQCIFLTKQICIGEYKYYYIHLTKKIDCLITDSQFLLTVCRFSRAYLGEGVLSP